jgi:signal transduction histidine kinase
MGKLTAAIAHELSQPLSAIGFNVDAAERGLNAGPPDVGALKEILRDVRFNNSRAAEVIARVRDLVLKREAPSELLNVNSFVAETLRLLDSEALRKSVHVSAELRPGIPLVIANRVQLQQVLINLAMNGMESMATAATRQLTVKTTALESNHVEVTVVDRGDGIGLTHMPRLFEPFFSTKREGMGLGLFFARSIIASHGGRIWADNNPGGGTTFHFTLPLAQDSETI